MKYRIQCAFEPMSNETDMQFSEIFETESREYALAFLWFNDYPNGEFICEFEEGEYAQIEYVNCGCHGLFL